MTTELNRSGSAANGRASGTWQASLSGVDAMALGISAGPVGFGLLVDAPGDLLAVPYALPEAAKRAAKGDDEPEEDEDDKDDDEDDDDEDEDDEDVDDEDEDDDDLDDDEDEDEDDDLDDEDEDDDYDDDDDDDDDEDEDFGGEEE